MLNDIINRVEDLKRHTKTNVDEVEKSKIPIIYDLKLEERFEYNLHGSEFMQWRDDTLLFLAHNIPFRTGWMNIKNHSFNKPFKQMVDNNEIIPFMMFINGKFIKWSDIEIISDCKYSYIKISNVQEYDRLDHDISCILLPDFIVYEETCMELLNDTLAYFMFDNRGFMVTEFAAGYTTVIRYKKRDLFFESINLIEGKRQVVSRLDKNNIVDKNNIILFRDGKFVTNLDIEFHGMNIFSVSNNKFNSHKVLAKVFYFIGEKRADNFLQSPNQNFITNTIYEAKSDQYIDALHGDFDFTYDKNLSYSENISNSLDYIMRYNSMFMDQVYIDNSPIITRNYTGKQLSQLVKDGYVTMSRKIGKDLSTRVMIFVNGSLYAYQNHVEYGYRTFKFPIIDILDNYIVEIIYFLDIDNRDFEIRFNSTGDDMKCLDPTINLNNAKLFTRDPKQKEFPVEVDDKTEFEIGLHWENTDTPYKYKMYPTSSYYYDRLLYLTFKNQFRYFFKRFTKEDITIELPDDFRYCNDESHFLVFINGNKLNRDNYRITTVKTTRPFTRPIIYTNIPINVNDRVDVFYLPISIEEEYNRSVINSSGNLAVMKSNLSYSLRRELYLIFIDGKKVPLSSLQNVSTNLIKIKATSGTKNLSILKYIPNEDTLNTIFNNISSKFESAINRLSPDYIKDNLLGDSKLTQPNASFDDDKFDIKKTVYRALEDHYIKPYMNDGDIYVYDFDQIFEERDPEGNIVNRVNDANEENRISR